MIACPKCDSQRLQVTAEILIDLEVDETGDELREVEQHKPSYGKFNWYTCNECGFTGILSDFTK